MLRIEDRKTGDFCIYNVICVCCKHVDKNRINITIETDCEKIKLRIADTLSMTALDAANKIAMSVCSDVSISIYGDRDYLNIAENTLLGADDSHCKMTGGIGHFFATDPNK